MSAHKNVPPDNTGYFTRSQAAYYLQLSLRTIDSMIKNKEIRARKRGDKNGSVRIPREEIDRMRKDIA